jgi:NADP-dependent 3-hydroxy acid dehydrogenase YdfG
MRFGDTRTDEAEGAILAHALATDDLRFKKGRCLSAEDVAESVLFVVTRPESVRIPALQIEHS